jgi:two-component system response regulator MprA
MRILIAEDKRSFALHIGRALESEGHSVTLAYDGAEALRLGRTACFDLILLDVMLPRLNGYDVIRRIRDDRLPTQTILVSARDAMQDIVTGLDSGADDYLTKPFALDVLLAKVRASERRIPQVPSITLQAADIDLRIDTFELQRGSRIATLTRTECALLEILMRRAPGIVTHDALIEYAWDAASDVSYDSLYVFIRGLRAKITHPGEDERLHTVRGVGYCIRNKA